MAGVADVNGDGLGDLAVGAPAFSAANRLVGAGYVVFGRATSAHLSPERPRNRRVRGPRFPADGFFGLAVAGLGDLTGDGKPDIAFGAPASDRNERPQSGSAYVIAGKPGADPVDAEAGLRVDGATAGDRLGASVAAVPDLNADQKPEFAAGAPFADALSREDAGAVIVRFGGGKARSWTRRASAHAASGSRAPRRTTASGASRRSAISTATVPPTCSSAARRAMPRGRDRGPGRRPRDPRPAPAGRPRPIQAWTRRWQDGCVAARNVEFLIDDSGSMEVTDPQLLRRTAAEYLISKPRNEGEVLGAYEFGPSGRRSSRPR